MLCKLYRVRTARTVFNSAKCLITLLYDAATCNNRSPVICNTLYYYTQCYIFRIAYWRNSWHNKAITLHVGFLYSVFTCNTPKLQTPTICCRYLKWETVYWNNFHLIVNSITKSMIIHIVNIYIPLADSPSATALSQQQYSPPWHKTWESAPQRSRSWHDC